MSNIFENPHEAAITPELREWIVQQASAGIAATKVLKAMLNAGWQEDVALYALESVLTEHLQGGQAQQQPQSATAALAEPAASRPMPGPDLTDSPRQIELAGRQVDVILSLKRPRVAVFAHFLSEQECDELIALAQPRMKRSLTVNKQSAAGGTEVNKSRTSDGMFFSRGENPLVAAIEARIAGLLRWPVSHGEGLQVLHYRPGAEYKPHYDYFDPRSPGTPALLKRGGQRVGTLLMYLNNPVKGGGTTFPAVGLEIAAQRGHALFFSYDRPHPDTLSLHGGAPVIEGEKWVATKWLREQEFT